ncbi:MAG: glycosyltransferase family 4 protein [Calditrichae bacterium]|nr:glycosyltransferase family 4 protein [Calditrichia bacterium]
MNSKKLNLMQITHDMAHGGLQNVILNICRCIDRDKFNISVLCLRNLGAFVPELEKMGVKVILLPQKEKTDYFSFHGVHKIIKKEKPDILHTHNTQPFIDGIIGSFFTSVKTIVHTDHNRMFPDKRRYMFAEWVVSHFATKVIGVSDYTSDNLNKYLKISRKKISTIVNGIEPEIFEKEIDKTKKLEELGIKNEGPVIGTIGRLVVEKGYHTLIDAMKMVVTQFPKAKLIFVGEGYLKNKLMRQVEEFKLSKNVIFLGSRNDAPELYHVFDLFAMSSISEGLPMVLLEAMAASCPIVSTDVGGIKSIVKNGLNGILVKPNNPEFLSEAIIKILKDSDLKEKYITESKKILNLRFTASVMTNNYEKLYLNGKNITTQN